MMITQYGIWNEDEEVWMLYDSIEDVLYENSDEEALEIFEFKPASLGHYKFETKLVKIDRPAEEKSE